MKRLLRRTEVAKKQLQRKVAAEKARETRARDTQSRQQLRHIAKIKRAYVNDARRFNYEDWKLGPLAPKRDVGAWREAFAAADPELVQNINLPQPELKAARKQAPIVCTGDRVVVIDGPNKGTVSEVERHDFESMMVSVKDVNMWRFKTPKWQLEREPQQPKSLPYNLDIPMTSVRLVHKMTVDGEVKDVVVEDISCYKPDLTYFGIPLDHKNYLGADGGNVWSYEWATRIRKRFPFLKDTDVRPLRYIAGHGPQDQELDPAIEEQWSSPDDDASGALIPYKWLEETEHERFACDTPRMEVDPQTFRFALDTEPFPAPVLDELRGKYSKFRDRHEPEYIAEKLNQDRQAKAMKRLKFDGQRLGVHSMVQVDKTGETRIRETKRTPGKGQKALNHVRPSPEQLEGLGQLITRTRAAKLADEPTAATV